MLLLFAIATTSILGGALLYNQIDDTANFTHGFCNRYLANVDRSMALIDTVRGYFRGADTWVEKDRASADGQMVTDGRFKQTYTNEFAGVWLCLDGYLHVGIAGGRTANDIMQEVRQKRQEQQRLSNANNSANTNGTNTTSRSNDLSQSSLNRYRDLDARLETQVRFVEQKYSMNHLLTIKELLVERMIDFEIFSIAVLQATNRIEINLVDYSNFNLTTYYLRKLGLYPSTAVYFNIHVTSQTELFSSIYGGDRIHGGSGTMTVNAICNITGRLGVLTNYHVAPVGSIVNHKNDWTRIGTSLRGYFGSRPILGIARGPIDAAFVPFDNQGDWTATADARYGNEKFTNIYLGAERHIEEGFPVKRIGQGHRHTFRSGRFDGIMNNHIESVSVTFHKASHGALRSITNSFRTYSCNPIGGDSGGPVYYVGKNGSLYLIGIMFGGNLSDGRVYSSRIREVMRILNVTPITQNTNLFLTVPNCYDEAVIVYSHHRLNGDIIIPYFIGGRPVVEIAPAAFAGRHITSLTIPSTVRRIGRGAFSGTHLSQITTPLLCASTRSLPNAGFGYMFGGSYYGYQRYLLPNLQRIIANNASTISSNEFYRISNINYLNLSTSPLDSIQSNAFYGTSILTLGLPRSVSYIARGALSGMNSLQQLTIPFLGRQLDLSRDHYSFSFIGHLFGVAFGNIAVQYRHVPNSLHTVRILYGTMLAPRAFYRMSSLRNIYLPHSIRILPRHAFAHTGIVRFDMPRDVIGVDIGLFYGARYLNRIRLNRTFAMSATVLKNHNAFIGTQLRYVFVQNETLVQRYRDNVAWNSLSGVVIRSGWGF